MKRKLLFICFAFLLAACSSGKGTSTPTLSSAAIMTSVKLTVDANSTNIVAMTPSATMAPSETNTPAVSSTLEQASTETSTATIPVTATVAQADSASLLSQSVSDNTKVNAGTTFKVTWTFKNLGSTTWTTDYTAKFWSDSLMGAADTFHFPNSVAPGGTIDITMTFTAPTQAGTAKTSWWLQNSQGVNFYPFYVIINVTIPPTDTNTLVPSATPTSTSTEAPTTNP